MSDVTIRDFIEQLVAVLDEGFEHPPKPFSYFTDHGGSGLLATLRKLSAAEVSLTSGGSSIAAHVHHLAFALQASAAWIGGDLTRPDWSNSWRVTEVSETEWSQLIEELEAAYRNARHSIETSAATSILAAGGAVAAIAHAAYHIGAIQQKLASLDLKPN